MNRFVIFASIWTVTGCSSASLQSSAADPSNVPAATAQRPEVELAALRAEHEVQSEELRTVRGQLALARAELRDLKGAPVCPTPEPKRPKSIRISKDHRPSEDSRTDRESAPAAEERPLLRLYGDGPVERLTTTDSVPQLPAFEPSPTPGEDAVETYRRGLSLVRGQQFAEASAVFSDFLSSHPTHPYADNALFWRGEICYLRGDYDDALKEFQHIEKRYPQGNKLPDALYRIGHIYLKRGDTRRAAAYFKQVRERFPDTAAARLALREDAS